MLSDNNDWCYLSLYYNMIQRDITQLLGILSIQNNIMGTHVLLESAKVAKISRFIHVSTDEVYGEQTNEQEAMSEEQVSVNTRAWILLSQSQYFDWWLAINLLLNQWCTRLREYVLNYSLNAARWQRPECPCIDMISWCTSIDNTVHDASLSLLSI